MSIPLLHASFIRSIAHSMSRPIVERAVPAKTAYPAAYEVLSSSTARGKRGSEVRDELGDSFDSADRTALTFAHVPAQVPETVQRVE